MERFGYADRNSKKKVKATEREFTSALFLLRCVELGLSMADLDHLDIGMILEMFAEKSNDSIEYAELADAEDVARF